MRSGRTVLVVALAGGVVLAALLLADQMGGPDVQEGTPEDRRGPPLADPGEVYDPVAAGEALPPGYRRVVARDVIRPVYQPQFVPAGEAGWDDTTLVLGVAVEGEAHAYPINVLNHREMVIDRIGGVPILSSW